MAQPPMGNGVNDRRTPRELFDALNDEFNFTLDGAASHENALVRRYCTLEGTFEMTESGPRKLSDHDGLRFRWEDEVVFLNPPYGRALLAPFVDQCAFWPNLGATVVALLPVRTEQPWWHDYIWCESLHRSYDSVEIRFLKGRVKYDGLGAAPFPSCVVVWRPE